MKEASGELEGIEIALITKDITTFSSDLDIKNNRKLKLEEELSNLSSTSTNDSTEVEKLKIGYTMHVSVDENYKFEKPKFEENKLVQFKNMPEEDAGKIMENISKKDSVKELSNVFESIISNFPSIGSIFCTSSG